MNAHASVGHDRRYLLTLSLAALGVVYGDIGTSPLYALRECFHGPHAIAATPGHVIGVLSLIFWALVIIVAIKYLMFILRADNRGEGGILALMALVAPHGPTRTGSFRWVLVMLGIVGAALLYGDGMITPAISVLSAVEGLEVATPVLSPYVVPVTIGILIAVFAVQHRGTASVGAIFGPLTLIWFAVIGVLGAMRLVQDTHILVAINPLYAVRFFADTGWIGFLVLGAVFLAVTGAEALYADMGHFGAKPIRLTWFAVVMPGLLLNYFGQGALLLSDPSAAVNPFYRLAPAWAVIPLVVLATIATVVASQALISGAFSITRQAVQLGFLPRVHIAHTSSREIGQIYIPFVNWGLMLICIALVLGFGSSSALAAAYGISVTATMVITTILFFVVSHERWKWPLPASIAVSAVFAVIDLAFFGANSVKILQGGWFPVAVALVIFSIMTTWKRGRGTLGANMQETMLPIDLFLKDTRLDELVRVPGTAVFMAGGDGTPPAMLHNIKHNKVLHETNVILSVTSADVPHIDDKERVSVENLGNRFWRIVVRYGFMEDPAIPEVLRRLKVDGLSFRTLDTTYFLGREVLIAGRSHTLAFWRQKLFGWLSRNARSATSYFGLPPNRVVELGTQVRL